MEASKKRYIDGLYEVLNGLEGRDEMPEKNKKLCTDIDRVAQAPTIMSMMEQAGRMNVEDIKYSSSCTLDMLHKIYNQHINEFNKIRLAALFGAVRTNNTKAMIDILEECGFTFCITELEKIFEITCNNKNLEIVVSFIGLYEKNHSDLLLISSDYFTSVLSTNHSDIVDWYLTHYEKHITADMLITQINEDGEILTNPDVVEKLFRLVIKLAKPEYTKKPNLYLLYVLTKCKDHFMELFRLLRNKYTDAESKKVFNVFIIRCDLTYYKTPVHTCHDSWVVEFVRFSSNNMIKKYIDGCVEDNANEKLAVLVYAACRYYRNDILKKIDIKSLVDGNFLDKSKCIEFLTSNLDILGLQTFKDKGVLLNTLKVPYLSSTMMSMIWSLESAENIVKLDLGYCCQRDFQLLRVLLQYNKTERIVELLGAPFEKKKNDTYSYDFRRELAKINPPSNMTNEEIYDRYKYTALSRRNLGRVIPTTID